MVRLPTSTLNQSVEAYLDQLLLLSKSAKSSDKMKAAFGIVALHIFGYKDFSRLANIFDRLIPQTDRELVKLTSWCAGKLIHHPRDEQTRYVAHLFVRALGWIHAPGRRARPLAAANLIQAIASNAGSCCSLYMLGLTTAAWKLVSHPSQLVLRDVSQCYGAFTRALMKYGRHELDSLLEFLYMLGVKLLSFETPVRAYAALLLFQELLSSYPDFFSTYVQQLWECFQHCFEESANEALIQCASFCASACLCVVDPKFFEMIADDVFDQAKTVILEFDVETVKYLCLIAQKTPDVMQQRIELIEQFSNELIENELFDPAFSLLRNVVWVFDTHIKPTADIFVSIVNAKITKNYQEFLVDYLRYFPDVSDQLRNGILEMIMAELRGNRKLETLELIAVLPESILKGNLDVVKLIESLSSHPDTIIRSSVPKAFFNAAKMSGTVDSETVFTKLFKHATYEVTHFVRESILRVIYENISKELGKPEFLDLLRVFLNDDSTTVRQVAMRIIGKITDWNPGAAYSLIRSALTSAFFILGNVASIRKRTTVAKILPDAIAAAGINVCLYSRRFISILIEALKPSQFVCENFLEENCQDIIVTRLLDALALLAPVDPKPVIDNVDKLIPLLINYLVPQSHRFIILSVLNVFVVLLSAPCSCAEVRTQVPFILSACSSLLASTRSMKARKATLRVIGAIGVIDVHEKGAPPLDTWSRDCDDELARQFYNPIRDKQETVPDMLLLNKKQHTEYYLATTVTALLKLFDDGVESLYLDIAKALVQVLTRAKLREVSLPLFDQFVAKLLDVMSRSSDDDVKQFLSVYSELILSSGYNTVPFVRQSLDLFRLRCNDYLMIDFLNVLLAFAKSLEQSFSPYYAEVVVVLVCFLDDWKTADVELSRRVLEIFVVIGPFAVDQHYLIIPQICDAILCQQTLPDVRIMSLESLSILLKKCDVSPYIGPVLRAASFGLHCPDEKTSEAGKHLYCLITKSHKDLGIDNKADNFWTREKNLAELGDSPGISRDLEYWFVPHKAPGVGEPHTFSNQTVTGRFNSMNLGSPQQLELWFYGVVYTFVASSPSPDIRVCAPLVNLHHPFALEIFNPAFYSCWCELKQPERTVIVWSFSEILLAPANYEIVARAILNLIVFMDKVHEPVDIPLSVVVSAGNRYGSPFYAIKLLEDKAIENKGISDEDAMTLLDIFLKMGRLSKGNAVYRTFQGLLKNQNLLLKLKMWDKAEHFFQEAYSRGERSASVFSGLVLSLSSLFRWENVMNYLNDFKAQKRNRKAKTAMYFAEAAMNLGRWDDLAVLLNDAPADSVECTMLSAFLSLHSKKWDSVAELVDQGFALLASRPIHFGADENGIHADLMLASQQLAEIAEMANWLMFEEKRNAIEEVWNERLKTAPRDFETWFRILSWRRQVIEVPQPRYVQLFQMGDAFLDSKSRFNAFNALFRGFKFDEADDAAKISYLVAEWAAGNQAQAIERMRLVLETVSPNYKKQCIVLFSEWLLSSDDSIGTLMEAHQHLSQVMNDSAFCSKRGCVRFSCSMNSPLLSPRIRKERSTRALTMPDSVIKDLTTDVLDVDILRNWASVNIGLMKVSFDAESFGSYVTNAIQALVRCCSVAPSFPDVVQLLNLFFENANEGNIFNSTAQDISLLQPKLLLQVRQQILVQLSHPCKHVQRFVHKLVLTLLSDHFHCLLSSVVVFTLSKNESRSAAAIEITNEFAGKRPDVWHEFTLVRSSLLRVAVTPYEKSLSRVERVIDYASTRNADRVRKTLTNLLLSAEDPVCGIQRAFADDFQVQLETLRRILSDSNAETMLKAAEQWCDMMKPLLMRTVYCKTAIQLSSVSEELCSKDSFIFAVPGTYKPGKELIQVVYFVQQVSVYMSKQQPKVVVMKGTDGKLYQYLLKGQEDLRLDERLMQFFSMINSFLKRESLLNGTHIRIINVITLSMKHGMVQWVSGTDTLRFIVTEYRKSIGKPATIEEELLCKYGIDRYNSMLPIQKLQIVSKICQELPDTDLANFMWLRATSAETWMNQVDRFCVTAGMTSIVGYIIGLGDRHHSNILIDRLTGEVVHIDFGDSFERAMKRRVLPEQVPFRLTRMMVRAMGVTGPEGSFKTAFVNMGTMLRARRGILLTVLSIFVQEPLTEPGHESDEQELEAPQFYQTQGNSSSHCLSAAFDEGRVKDRGKGLSHREIRRRVKEKLMGFDVPGQTIANTVEEQADLLIGQATNLYNQAKMFHEWFPFW